MIAFRCTHFCRIRDGAERPSPSPPPPPHDNYLKDETDPNKLYIYIYNWKSNSPETPVRFRPIQKKLKL